MKLLQLNINADVCGAQLQRLLQDVDKRDYQIETFKAQQEEGQKREENLRRQLDKLTYDKNSLQADLSSSRDELDESRQNIQVTQSHLADFKLLSTYQVTKGSTVYLPV